MASDGIVCGALLAASTATAAASSTVLLRGVEYPDPPAWQPRAAWAFGIWWPIFAASLGHAVYVAVVPDAVSVAPWGMVASYALCTAWAVAFARHRAYRVAAALLLAAAAVSVATVAADSRGASGWDGLALEVASDLLAGWLVVAASLAACVALERATGDRVSAWTLLAPVACTSAAAALCARPLLLVPYAWLLVARRAADLPAAVAAVLGVACGLVPAVARRD